MSGDLRNIFLYAFMYRPGYSSLYDSCCLDLSCCFCSHSVVSQEVVSFFRYMCFSNFGYVYLPTGDVLDYASLHLRPLHRVRIYDGYVQGAYSVFHSAYGSSPGGIF